MCVSDDPNLMQWPAQLVEKGDLVVASTAEVYGEAGLVVADEQRRTFAAALTDALVDGYSGLRVIGDNTSLVRGGERLAAWMNWEIVADEFMAANPVTGLCAFRRTDMEPSTVGQVEGLHRNLVGG
jgi:hypothetical protein